MKEGYSSVSLRRETRDWERRDWTLESLVLGVVQRASTTTYFKPLLPVILRVDRSERSRYICAWLGACWLLGCLGPIAIPFDSSSVQRIIAMPPDGLPAAPTAFREFRYILSSFDPALSPSVCMHGGVGVCIKSGRWTTSKSSKRAKCYFFSLIFASWYKKNILKFSKI